MNRCLRSHRAFGVIISAEGNLSGLVGRVVAQVGSRANLHTILITRTANKTRGPKLGSVKGPTTWL